MLTPNRHVRRARAVAVAVGALAASLGAMGLTGWAWDVPVLRTLGTALIDMRANTALGIMVAAAGVIGGVRRPAPAWTRVAGLLVGLLGVASLLQHLTGLDFGIDRLAFKDVAVAAHGLPPGRMALGTALSFTALGAALGGLERWPSFAQSCAALAGVLGYVALLGHAFEVNELTGLGRVTGHIALPTAMALIALGAGVITATAGAGWASLLTRSDTGGIIARRLMPAVTVGPPAIVWMRLLGEREGWFGSGLGASVEAVAQIVLLGALVWSMASRLSALDKARALVGKQREEVIDKLTASEARVRRLVDANVIGVAFWTRGGPVLEANDALLSLVAVPRGSPLDLHVLTPAEWSNADAVADRELLASGTCTPYEKELLRPDKTRIPVIVATAALTTAGDELISFVLDLSALKRVETEVRTLNADLERRVRERTAELEDANSDLDAFNHTVSHDLRAPIRSLHGFTGILLDGQGAELPERTRVMLGHIRSAATRMGELVDGLLAFARLGRQGLHYQRVSTEALVHASIETLRPLQTGRNVAIDVHSLPDCMGDPTLLELVWTNLVGNALKFTGRREAARVEIGAEAGPEGTVRYWIRDNGAGFDMKHAGQLFGVFKRLHSAADFEGTGIGLASVQRIVQRHGGRIDAQAEPDRGATFRFTLPEAPAEA